MVADEVPPLRIRELGRRPYEPVWRAMQEFTESRDADTPDELWCLEHEAVFTQGQAGKAEHILDPGNIPIVQIDRGGQVTYHGPGQLVVYFLLDVRRRNMGPRALVSLIEESVITLLADFGIQAGLRERAPGVYVDGAKIAALGLRIRRGLSYHGLSLNVDMDLSPYSLINPCGYAGLPSTQIRDQLASPPPGLFEEVHAGLLGHLRGRLAGTEGTGNGRESQ